MICGSVWKMRNYLRVRGEYARLHLIKKWLLELPPRARRIPLPGFFRGGLTRNYLRVRGEYSWYFPTSSVVTELPPRARRIRLYYWGDDQDEGTTSACAENTLGFVDDDGVYRNYLRVRGEYPFSSTLIFEMVELPPRARRIP